MPVRLCTRKAECEVELGLVIGNSRETRRDRARDRLTEVRQPPN